MKDKNGIVDVLWGTIQLSQGCYFWLAFHTPVHSPWQRAYLALPLLGFAGYFFAFQRFRRRMPREQADVRPAATWRLFLAVLILTAVAGFALMQHAALVLPAMIMWTINAVPYSFVCRLDRYWKVGTLLIMTFAWPFVVQAAPNLFALERWNWFFFGLCWLLSGIVTLAHYRPLRIAA